MPAGWQPFEVAPVKGQVEITVDASGQVFLRGVATSEEAAREIEAAARSVPGVSHVDSQLKVMARRGGDENPPLRDGDLMVEPRRAPEEGPPPPARAGGSRLGSPSTGRLPLRAPNRRPCAQPGSIKKT